MLPLAEIIVRTAEAYLAIGALIAVLVTVFGIGRVLPHAGHVTVGARLLMLPGAALLWPALLRSWIAGS